MIDRELRIDWLGLKPSLAMRTLGHNLAIAGALCRAHVVGFAHGMLFERVGHLGPTHSWFPGCQFDAPIVRHEPEEIRLEFKAR